MPPLWPSHPQPPAPYPRGYDLPKKKRLCMFAEEECHGDMALLQALLGLEERSTSLTCRGVTITQLQLVYLRYRNWPGASDPTPKSCELVESLGEVECQTTVHNLDKILERIRAHVRDKLLPKIQAGQILLKGGWQVGAIGRIVKEVSPNCKYRLTKRSLETLSKVGVPGAVLQKLEAWRGKEGRSKGKKVLSKEHFLDALSNVLDQDERERYQGLVLGHAEMRDDQTLSSPEEYTAGNLFPWYGGAGSSGGESQ
jgi:hypothetical protein